MNNNRNNRRRGRGNRNQGGNNQNRIDSRARGNAPQLLDKYKKLAQDAQHNGDRVQAEYYLQFADHYFRVIADNKARQDEARAKRNDERGSDRSQSGEDGDDEDGDNRRKNNRRSRGRRDDQEGGPYSEGEAGVEGEAAETGEETAKPRRRSRKADTEDQGDKPRRKPRSSNRTRSNSDDGDAGEIDSSVLPPAIGGDDSSKASDSDDNLEQVG